MPDPIRINYRPNPSSIPFHRDRSKVKALCGPVGSGKTLAAAFEIVLLAQESDIPTRHLVLRESYRELHDSTLKTWMEWLEPISRYVKQDERVLFSIPNHSGTVIEHEVHFRHARRVEDASKFLSTEYSSIWLEEVVPAFERDMGIIGGGLPEGVFKIALMRVRQKGAPRLQIVLTFNPPSKYHWAYKTFFEPPTEDLKKRNYALFRQPPKENAPNLPEGYYEGLEETLDTDMRRRFVEGECVTYYPGERVFSSIHEQIHFKENMKPYPGCPLVIMFDFGRTPCALIGQVLPDARMRIYREIQLFDAGVEKLAERLKVVMRDHFAEFDTWRCWGDPAGGAPNQTDEKTCFGVLASHGFSVLPGAIDYAARLEAVIQRTERFIDGEPGLLIDKNHCPTLMEGLLGGYRYPKAHDGHISAKPLKNQFSHLCDALQYGCTGEFDVRSGTRKGGAKPVVLSLPKFNPFSRGVHIGRRRGASWMSN